MAITHTLTTGDIIQKIKDRIIEKFQEQKTNLFNTSGRIYGRNWRDLSEDYKEYKFKEIGRIYPINIFTGKLLNSLLEKAIVVEDTFQGEDLIFQVSLDTNRMDDVVYAEEVNKYREYLGFSNQEKEEILQIVQETLREIFGAD